MPSPDPFARLAEKAGAAPARAQQIASAPAPAAKPPKAQQRTPKINRDQFFGAANRAASSGKGAAFLKFNARVIDNLSSGDRVKLNEIISPTLGQTERQGLATDYSSKQHVSLGEKIASVPATAVMQITQGLSSSPAGAVELAKRAAPAAYHAIRGGTNPGSQAAYQDKHPEAGKAFGAVNDLGRAFIQSTIADVKRPLDRPGYLALDALTAGNLLAKGATVAGLLKVPAERSLAFDGGKVQPQASPATLTRAVQHKIDRVSEKHPAVARARVASRIPFEQQREFDRASAPAAPFAAARQKLTRGEDFAYDVIRRYGDKAQQRIDQEIAFRKDRIKNAPSLVEKAHQTKRLVQLNLAHSHVTNPSPKLQKAISLGRDLAHQGEQTKVEIGQLNPETAALHVHEASVAGTGRTAGAGAFYAPDTARAPIKSIGQRSRAAVTGKPRPLVKQSQQILFSQGRARAGSKLTLEDFQKTTRYTAHLKDIEAAAKFSKPLNPEIPGGLELGHRYFNPDAVKIPRSFKEEPAAADLEGLTPREIGDRLTGDHEALLRNTFPDEASLRNLPPEMRSKVGQIDEKVAHAFEAHGQKPPRHGIAKALGGLFDAANDTTKLALVYLKPAYVPVNYAGNVGFGLIHQGPWLPVNLAKASARAGHFKPETLRQIDTETGEGAARSLATSRGAPTSKALHAVANFQGRLADTGPRRAAWIHEAAQRGYKTDAQVTKLLTDPALRPVLNQVSGNAEQAMVKFRGMSEGERATIARAFFLYPWIRGAAIYGARLPLDRPGRAAFLAHLGEQGHEDVRKRLGQLASYMSDLSPIGSPQKKLGTDVQKVVSLSGVTPFGTARDVLQTVGRTLTGEGTGKNLIQYANPAVKATFEGITGYNTFTGHNYPKGTKPTDIVAQSLYGSAPLVQLYKGLHQKPQTEPFTGSPLKQPNYVQGGPKEAIGRFLAGGLYPRELNVTAAQAKGTAERRADLAPAERAYRNDFDKIRQQARAFKVPGGVPREVLVDLKWRRELDTAIGEQKKHGAVSPRDKAAATAAVFAARFPDSSKQVVDALQKAKTEDDYKAFYRELRGEGLSALSKWNSEMNGAEREARAAAAH